LGQTAVFEIPSIARCDTSRMPQKSRHRAAAEDDGLPMIRQKCAAASVLLRVGVRRFESWRDGILRLLRSQKQPCGSGQLRVKILDRRLLPANKTYASQNYPCTNFTRSLRRRAGACNHKVVQRSHLSNVRVACGALVETATTAMAMSTSACSKCVLIVQLLLLRFRIV